MSGKPVLSLASAKKKTKVVVDADGEVVEVPDETPSPLPVSMAAASPAPPASSTTPRQLSKLSAPSPTSAGGGMRLSHVSPRVAGMGGSLRSPLNAVGSGGAGGSGLFHHHRASGSGSGSGSGQLSFLSQLSPGQQVLSPAARAAEEKKNTRNLRVAIDRIRNGGGEGGAPQTPTTPEDSKLAARRQRSLSTSGGGPPLSGGIGSPAPASGWEDPNASAASIAAIGASMGIDINTLTPDQVLKLMAHATSMIEEKEKEARTAAELGATVLDQNQSLERAVAELNEQNAKLADELETATQQRETYKARCTELMNSNKELFAASGNANTANPYADASPDALTAVQLWFKSELGGNSTGSSDGAAANQKSSDHNKEEHAAAIAAASANGSSPPPPQPVHNPDSQYSGSLETDLVTLRRKITKERKLTKLQLNELEDSLRAAQEHNATLENDLKLYYEQRRAAAAGGVGSTSGVAGVIAAHTELKQKLAAAQTRITELEAAAVQQDIKSQASTRMALSQAKRAANEQAQKYEAELKSERDARMSSDNERSTLKHERSQLQLAWKEEVRQQQKRLAEVTEKAGEEVKTEKQARANAESAVEQLKQQLALVESNWRDDQKARQQRSEAAAAEYEQQIKQQRAAFLTADAKLHDIERVNLTLETKVADDAKAYQKRVTELTASIDALTRDKRGLEAQLTDVNARLEANATAAVNERTALERRLSERHASELTSEQKLRTELEAARDELKSKLQTLESTLKGDAKEQQNRAQASIAELESEVKSERTKRSELQSAFDSTSAKLKAAESDLAADRNRLASTESELQTIRTAKSSLEAAVAELKQQISRAESDRLTLASSHASQLSEADAKYTALINAEKAARATAESARDQLKTELANLGMYKLAAAAWNLESALIS